MSRSLTRLAKTGLCAMAFAATMCVHSESHASCGSAACFLLTGEEGAVQPEGRLSVGILYTYTISKLDKGVSGRVTSVDQEERQLVESQKIGPELAVTVREATTAAVGRFKRAAIGVRSFARRSFL